MITILTHTAAWVAAGAALSLSTAYRRRASQGAPTQSLGRHFGAGGRSDANRIDNSDLLILDGIS